MKYLITFLLLVGSCFAANTTVTFTITDSDSQIWANGSYVVTFLPTPGNPGPYFVDGVPMTAAQKGPFTGVMNGSGTGSISLISNTSITPSGTKWQFVIAPNASANSSTMSTAVTGVSQDFSASFSSQVRAPRFPALGTSSWGYLDGEVTPIPNPGGAYFNVTSKTVRIWDGTQWIAGSGTANGLIISPAGIVPPPTPLASVSCPTGEAPFMYGLNASSQYQPLAAWNTSGIPPSPAGQINFCWPLTYNDSGTSFHPNRAFSVMHIAGAGGLSNSTTNDESAIMGLMYNTGTGQSFHQFLTFYGEAVVSGTPTFGGHAGGETSVSVYRGNFTDQSTSITGGGGFYTFSGQYEHNGSSTTAGGVYHAFLSSTGGSGNMANANSSGYNCGGGFGGTETQWWFSCFNASIPLPRWPGISGLGNVGYFSASFGTNANDYDLYMSGVNSAGTPAGYNSLVGPTFFGNLAHVTAGYQVELLGAQKIKAGAGVRQLDLFGSTSSFCGISTDATSTTEIHTCPLSAPGLGTVTSVTGTAPIVSSGGATPAISCPTCLTTATAPVGVQAASTTLLGGDVAVAATTSTTVLSHSVTMPSSGCPCRVFAAYNFYALSGAGLTSTGWITDGTIEFGTTMTTASGGGVNYPYTGSSFSTSTYSNSASVTFTFKVFSSDATTVKQVSPVGTPTQNSYLNLVVFTSN